jgi:hypothetical protein|tara:strand:- start:723 stop:1067 length:345 start_codon:yes stop_codon:yes gene_type:complete
MCRYEGGVDLGLGQSPDTLRICGKSTPTALPADSRIAASWKFRPLSRRRGCCHHRKQPCDRGGLSCRAAESTRPKVTRGFGDCVIPGKQIVNTIGIPKIIQLSNAIYYLRPVNI